MKQGKEQNGAQEFVRFYEKTGSAYVNRTLVVPIIEASHATAGEVFDRLDAALKGMWKQFAADKEFAKRVFVAPLYFGGGAYFGGGDKAVMRLSEYKHPKVKAAGESDLGLALATLERKLTGLKDWYDEEYTQTVFVLLATGRTDPLFSSALEQLKQKGRFHYGLKFAVALGTDADKDVLSAFTDNPETVGDEFGLYHGYEPLDSVAGSFGFFLSMACAYEKEDRVVMVLEDGRKWVLLATCPDDVSEAELRLVEKEDGELAVVEVYGKTVSEFYTFGGDGLEQFASDRRNYHARPECFFVRGGIVYVLWQTSHCNRKYAVLHRYRKQELENGELLADDGLLDELW